MQLGTHDVVDTTVGSETGTTTVTSAFSEHSTARGVLYNFVYITEEGKVDFGRSFLLALDRHNHTLPFNLYPGHYQVYVYDIEQNGTLSTGVEYPAELLTTNISETEYGR
jgi:hypothetical protein